MSKPTAPESGSYTIACPYCGTMYDAELTGKLQEITCAQPKCNSSWHQGVFQVFPAVVTNKDRRGMGKNQPALWTIRISHQEGESLLTFNSYVSIQLKKKDVISVSYEKKSKGVFRKEWTGEWNTTPKGLVNQALHAGWTL